MFEIGKQFGFEAAHRLERAIDTEASRRIHGHSYRVEVTLHGAPDPVSGMLVDLGVLAAALAAVRERLDHRLLNEVAGLGAPTMENLALFIWRALVPQFPALASVSVFRDSLGERCVYRPVEKTG
jgi:6-pyruvoyltetrahydropterin/6-carboxytetrahydropterin synthase